MALGLLSISSFLRVLLLTWAVLLLDSVSQVDAGHVTALVMVICISILVNRSAELVLSSVTGSRIVLMVSISTSVYALYIAGLLLETISVGFRSVSLGFRMFANVAAGHVITDLVIALRFYSNLGDLFIVELGYTGLCCILFYELAVAAVQIMVYMALSLVYACVM